MSFIDFFKQLCILNVGIDFTLLEGGIDGYSIDFGNLKLPNGYKYSEKIKEGCFPYTIVKE